MVVNVALTTNDNPFDPFKQFDEWQAFDDYKGYGTCSYLARIVRTSEELSEASQLYALEAAIDEIIRMNPEGIYKKVVLTDDEKETK